MSEKRLSLTQNGQVRYELKMPYRDGTTHVIFDPLGFIARLVALIPKPRVPLVDWYFAEVEKLTAEVVQA